MKTSFSRLLGENYVIIKKLSVPRNVKMNKLSRGRWGVGSLQTWWFNSKINKWTIFITKSKIKINHWNQSVKKKKRPYVQNDMRVSG